MSRSAVPSHAQVEMLLESLEERRWLATGHARTSHARDRTRAAWQEVAVKLNSDGSGCIKNWQQWAKYWKDKKSAVRKKASQIRMARQRTGGGELEERFLSAIEQRIIAVIGGERFFIGDRELEIEHIFEPGPSSNLNLNVPNNISEAPDAMDLSIQEDVNEDLQTPESESILQSHVEILPAPEEATTTTTAALLQTEFTPTLSDVQPGPSSIRPNADSPPEVAHRSNAPIASSLPRRRRLVTARRRLIQRSPPSQRRSHMASLTERFIAIEERRLENERLLIENQQKMLDVLKNISESWSRQTQAL
ncbi:uncharacterized protein LOC115455000 [Manduca sexta]|uniref:uncharacterized protein LOC115455000 n=1 Tax=Manduca sexta TaxID=7130 RepID=UPI00188F4B09|nr:uncharacterized protein LOC115455000 [Manduca sexta]